MIFTSLQFLVYFPLVVWIYFLLPSSARWVWLLAASAYFYMVFIPSYIFILAFLVLIDYTAGILIERAEGRRRRAWLLLSVAANLGMLGAFKYFNFFNDTLSDLLGWFDVNNPLPVSSLVLPIGLSFHTFQSLSYTFEVYYRRQKAERHLGIYALYVMFFPQLVAGPIERPAHLLPQFRQVHEFDGARAAEGLKLMLWGFFQKLVIADHLALFVNNAYTAPAAAHPLDLIAATALFAIQIYCDFSAYSDIAVGAAQVLGFRLIRNFDRPYLAASVGEFWRRWHISLSTWFRDYVYIPLGGNRNGRARQIVNVLVVFALSGLWHGARWSFVLWGLLHGLYVSIEILWKAWRGGSSPTGIWKALAQLRTFALVCAAWVFFRANSTGDAFVIFHRLGGFLIHPRAWTLAGAFGAAAFPRYELFTTLAAIGFWAIVQLGQGRLSFRRWVAAQPLAGRWSLYYAGVLVVLLFGQIDGAREFIYFQF